MKHERLSGVNGLVRKSGCCDSVNTWDTSFSPLNTNSFIEGGANIDVLRIRSSAGVLHQVYCTVIIS